jgi:hypothetical protein
VAAVKTDADTAAKNEQHKTAWDADTMGFGKHSFHFIDPDTINPEDYARKLEGEEQHFGDVRQYNSAFNEKHPENDVSLDDLSRIGTIISVPSDHPLEGDWVVTNMPAVKAGTVYCRAKRRTEDDSIPDGVYGEETEIPAHELGCAVDEKNEFPQVPTKLVQRGKVTREQRERLTKR